MLIRIVMGALSGALAGVITYLVVRKPQERRVTFAVVFVVAFVAVYTVSDQFLVPRIEAWRSQGDIDETLQKIPAYPQIAKYDPETYQQIKGELERSRQSGETQAQMEVRVRAIIGKLVQKYLYRASDDAIIDYMEVFAQEIEELTSQSPDLCYKFLFPQQSEPIAISQYLKVETQQADLQALAKLIQTGAENPHPKDISGYAPLMKKVAAKLRKDYADDLALLQKPLTPGIDRQKVCKVMAGVFREALKLPREESSLVLRYILAVGWR